MSHTFSPDDNVQAGWPTHSPVFGLSRDVHYSWQSHFHHSAATIGIARTQDDESSSQPGDQGSRRFLTLAWVNTRRRDSQVTAQKTRPEPSASLRAGSGPPDR